MPPERLRPMMARSEFQVYQVDPGVARVVADILSTGKDWPPLIFRDGQIFKFESNEVMESWMIGEYGGHAKYLEISVK